MPGFGTTGDYDERAATWDDEPDRRARSQTVARRINELVGPTPATRVLEYGAGTGLLGFALKPFVGHMTLADISEGMLAQVQKKIAASEMTDVEWRRLDLTTDPLPAERYDLIGLQLILHHIMDTDQILGALRACLAPDGVLVVADMDLEDGSFHREAYEGYFGFEREPLGEKVLAAGFASVEFDDVLTVHKVRGGVEREYPMFLMIART